MDVSSTHIESVSKEDANDFMARFEILGNVGLGVWHYGLFHKDQLLSVITFGTTCFGGKRGWLADLAQKHSVKILQICRGGTIPDSPKGTPSRAISMSCKALRLEHGPFIAVAYADESLGEIGTIYQASGAIYTGKTNPKGQANYVINGLKYSAWSVRKLYGTRDRKKLYNIDPQLEIIPLEPKHRYVFVSAPKLLRKALIKDIEPFRTDYPKRL